MKLKEFLPTRWTGAGAPVRSDESFPMLSLHREMNRVFDDFFRDFETASPSLWGRDGNGAGFPRVDVSETETEMHVEADLPGIEEKDIDVTLANGLLTIGGEMKTEKEEKEKDYHRVERSHGSFERSIRLPAEVDDSKVDAVFKKGVLHITLAKTNPSANRKKIEVKSSS